MRVILIAMASVGVAHADEVVEIHAWVEAHGASNAALGSNRDYICQEVVVGPRHEPALVCMDQQAVSRRVVGGDEPAVKNLYSYTVNVVRRGHVVTLIDVPVKADRLDPIVRPVNDPLPSWHPFVMAKDGASIVVGDPGDAGACTPVRAPYPGPKSEHERAWNALSVELQQRICAARGSYVWTDGQFTRASPARK